ncbi:hypothetical protein GX563_01300 [Candidatus Bathyarchaeota archaeon]|nr:hypothetical protein [Candidatus Bathyarchaeota archaeon]
MTEYSLHQEIKTYYSIPGDKFEEPLNNYIIDILRGQMAIEIQTKNFSAIKDKLKTLTKTHQVRLVYPLPENRIITCTAKDNTVLYKRKSPRKGVLHDVFRELVMVPGIIGSSNFSMEVLFVDEEEVRCADGKGSWRRRGVSIKERRLLGVNRRILFESKNDFLMLLPDSLSRDFTNSELAQQAKIPLRVARQITYCYRKSGLLSVAGKRGRAFIFRKNG